MSSRNVLAWFHADAKGPAENDSIRRVMSAISKRVSGPGISVFTAIPNLSLGLRSPQFKFESSQYMRDLRRIAGRIIRIS